MYLKTIKTLPTFNIFINIYFKDDKWRKYDYFVHRVNYVQQWRKYTKIYCKDIKNLPSTPKLKPSKYLLLNLFSTKCWEIFLLFFFYIQEKKTMFWNLIYNLPQPLFFSWIPFPLFWRSILREIEWCKSIVMGIWPMGEWCEVYMWICDDKNKE